MAELFSTALLFGGSLGMLAAYLGLANAVYNVISTCKKMTKLFNSYYDYILDDSVDNEQAIIKAIKECYGYGFF